MPLWNYAISETRKVSGGPVGVGSRYRQTRTLPTRSEETLEVTEFEPDHRLAIRGPLGPFEAEVTYLLTAAGDGTSVSNTSLIHCSRNAKAVMIMMASSVGRLSLRFDAMYCALAAASLVLFLDPISDRLSVPPALVAAGAAGILGWAILLYRVAGRRRLRPWLVGVLTTNLVAATTIAGYAAAEPWQGAFTILLVAVSVEVAAFAASQAVALRQLRA